MPETLFGEADVCRGRSFNLYADFINYLDDKVLKQRPPISTTNMVQILCTGDQGEKGEEDVEMKSEVTQDIRHGPAVQER